MECILVSFFERFWSIWGVKLGCKIDQKSLKNGIEKTIEKRKATRWPTRRPKTYAHAEARPNQAQGDGVGGEANLSPEGENNITTNTPC